MLIIAKYETYNIAVYSVEKNTDIDRERESECLI